MQRAHEGHRKQEHGGKVSDEHRKAELDSSSPPDPETTDDHEDFQKEAEAWDDVTGEPLSVSGAFQLILKFPSFSVTATFWGLVAVLRGFP